MRAIRSSTAPPAAPAAGSVVDGYDWLHPMLVKELRQGLRSQWFSAVFLFFLVCLCGLTAVCLLGAPDGPGRDPFVNSIELGLYGCVVLVVHVLIPFRGLIHGDADTESGNRELLKLTGITSGIAWTKLKSTWLMQGLVLASLLLCLVVRDLAGGPSSGVGVGDFVTLGWLGVGALFTSYWGLLSSTLTRFRRLFAGAFFLGVLLPALEASIFTSVRMCMDAPLPSVVILCFVWASTSLFTCLLPYAYAEARYCCAD